MSKYTELVKDLRLYMNDGTDELRREAADAIERLTQAVANYAEQAAEQEVKTGRWIPATEQLPEATGHKMYWVIVRSKYPENKEMFGQVAEYEARFGHPFWDVAQSEYVTHWMPLPTPPKEETE